MNDSLSEMIRGARLRRGLTQAELARRLPFASDGGPLSRTFIAGLEQGHLCRMDPLFIQRLALELGLEPYDVWVAMGDRMWERMDVDAKEWIRERVNV